MEDNNKLFEELKKILKERCDCKQQIAMESTILEDLQLDSLSLMTFVTILEQKYDMCLDELDENPETVGDLVKEIQARAV